MKEIFKKIVVVILTLEARLMLARNKPRIIGVTGSVGKTSTKDLIYTVVSSAYSARKNEKSLNSEFGVPLTILNLKSAWNSLVGWLINLGFGLWRAIILNSQFIVQYLVLEIGADHPGDIKSLVSWLKPEIGVLTGFGNEVPVHIEFFPTIGDLVREKSELLKALPEDGTAIINHDDERAWEAREVTEAKVLSYGFNENSDVHGDNFHISYENDLPKGVNFRVDYAGKSVPVRLCGVLGNGVAYSALAAFAVGTTQAINVVSIAEALGSHLFAPGRMKILKGINHSILIDDTYNSSPTAVKLALDTLHDLNTETRFRNPVSVCRKIAVLGDMMELGEYSEQEHKKVGTWVRGIADVLVCVGERAKLIGKGAINDGFEKNNVHELSNSQEAGKFLVGFVKEGDIVLLKASQSIRLERATEQLLADPTKASELLVRQEKEWKEIN